jgi:hypothetical protein
MSNTTIAEVVQHLESLPDNLQQQALNYIRQLSPSIQHGVQGKKLTHFAGMIPSDDLELMREAIERDCEQVDLDEW